MHYQTQYFCIYIAENSGCEVFECVNIYSVPRLVSWIEYNNRESCFCHCYAVHSTLSSYLIQTANSFVAQVNMMYFLLSLLVALLLCHGITWCVACSQFLVSPCRHESLSLYAFRWKSLWWAVKLKKKCAWSVCSSNMRSRSALLFPLHLCAVETGDTACHLSLSTSFLSSVTFCMYLWVNFIVTVLKYSANLHSLLKD